jgi:hypothetical protein
MVLHSLFALTLIVADAPKAARLPSADEIIAIMAQRDDERRLELEGYTSVRRYVLENVKHHKHAEMLVRMVYRKDGSKEFDVISSSGWSGARKHVFPRLLEAETEASRPGGPEDSRITPQNYSFTMLRTDEVEGRKAYVIEVTPKKEKKYLMRGTIWLDAEDFAIVRIEGEPAKNPSFWTKSVQFVHKYEKHEPLWLARPILPLATYESSAPPNCGSITSITSSTTPLLSKRVYREESLENRRPAYRRGPVRFCSRKNRRRPRDP